MSDTSIDTNHFSQLPARKSADQDSNNDDQSGAPVKNRNRNYRLGLGLCCLVFVACGEVVCSQTRSAEIAAGPSEIVHMRYSPGDQILESMRRITTPAQDGPPPTDLYRICISKIQNAPEEAYGPCVLYLERSYSDDVERVDYVKDWIIKFENARPQIEFLQSLTPNPHAAWIVYDPDMMIDLPQTSDDKGRYKMLITRSFADLTEEAMLRRAEAVYPGPSEMIKDVFGSLGERVEGSAKEMAPIWGSPGSDRIELTKTVTARAVRYYYDVSVAARKEPHLSTGVTAQATSLKYDAGIKHFEYYSHGKDAFNNVYVADMTLEWTFHCGPLCGMGFWRNKLVVLDSQGNVVALYLDAPGNSADWVS